MSGASSHQCESAPAPRQLRQEEKEVVLALIRHSPSFETLARKLEDIQVANMNDGGMGSIEFQPSDKRDRRFGFELATAEYTDEDHILIIIALNLDQNGNLFELDFWKVDFSPLIRYPRVDELTIVPRAKG